MAKRDWLIVAALLAVLLVLTLPVLTFPIGGDQGAFAVIGQAILDGKEPYTSVWDIKPPGIFYVFATAIAVVGPSMGGLHVLDMLVFIVVGCVLYWLGRRMAGRQVGLLACAGFAAYYFTESFWSLTQNDGIALIPMSLALVATIKAGDGGRAARRWAALAGALCVLIVSFKYPFVFFGGMLFAVYVIRISPFTSDPTRRRDAVRGVGVFLAGAAIAGVVGLLLLVFGNMLDALIENLRITAAYSASAGGMSNLLTALFQSDGALIRFHSWQEPLLLALAWPVLRWRVPRLRRAEPGWWAVWLWLLAGIIILAIQARGLPYHWLPMLPPLILLAVDAFDRLASGLWQVLRRVHVLPAAIDLRRWLRVATAGGLVFLFLVMWRTLWQPNLAYLSGQQSAGDYLHQFSAVGFDAAESVAMADYLRAHAAEDETLFIYGFRPEVYLLSGLRPVGRFIMNHYLVAAWCPPEWRRENVDALWLKLPAYVLVLQGDFTPWVIGRDADSHTLLQEDVDLNNWLMYNYDRVDEIGAFIVWQRKPDARPLG